MSGTEVRTIAEGRHATQWHENLDANVANHHARPRHPHTQEATKYRRRARPTGSRVQGAVRARSAGGGEGVQPGPSRVYQAAAE